MTCFESLSRGGVQKSGQNPVENCSLSGELNFVNYRLRVGICWRGDERQKMRKVLKEGKKNWITGPDRGLP